MTHTFQERIKWFLIAVAIPLLSSCWKAEEVFLTVDSVIDLKELPAREKLLYENAFDGSKSMDGWAMEGPGKIAFSNGWIEHIGYIPPGS